MSDVVKGADNGNGLQVVSIARFAGWVSNADI